MLLFFCPQEAPQPKKKQRLDVAGNAATGAAESTTVFVGNLSWGATEDDIKRHFKDCGSVGLRGCWAA